MDRDDFYKLHEDAKSNTGATAYLMMQELSLPKIVDAPKQVTLLGLKIDKLSKNILDELEEKYGENLYIAFSIAIHKYWFACCECAAYIKLCIKNGSIRNTPRMQKMATPSGYADMEGWANTLSEGLAPIKPSDELIAYFKHTFESENLDLDSKSTLKCMALYWLRQAEVEFKNGNSNLSFDLLYEANQAMDSVTAYSVWEDAFKEGSINARREQATISATARYKQDPKQKERKFVFECWNAWQVEPEQYKSKAEFARAMLDKCEHLVSQKKIEDWCRSWEAK